MGIDGSYAVSAVMSGKQMDVRANVVTEGEKLTVTMDAPVIGKVTARGRLAADGTFAAEGETRVLLKRIKYVVKGQVDSEGRLTATCSTDKGSIEIVGNRFDG